MPSSDVKGGALQSILDSLGEKNDEKKQIRNQYLERFATTFRLPNQDTVNEAQAELIKDTIETIQDNKIGIFEVPTLKEESINLICSICTWLKENSNIIKHTNKNTDQGEGSKKRSYGEVDQEGFEKFSLTEEGDHGKDINNSISKRKRLSGEQFEEDELHVYSLESSTIKSQSPELTVNESRKEGKNEKGKSKAMPSVDSEEDEMPDAKLICVFRSRSRLEETINELRTFDFIQKDFDVFEGVSDQNFSSTFRSQKIQVIFLHIDDLIKHDRKTSLNDAIGDGILLFDESQDIVDYVINEYSVVVGESDFEVAISHLENALNEQAKEEVKNELEKILENLVKFENFFGATDTPKSPFMSPAKFLDQVISGGIDEKTLQDLANWLRQTANNHTTLPSDKSALQSIQILMENLINQDLEGWIHYPDETLYAKNSSIRRQKEGLLLKYQLINPNVVLEPIIQQARSVILLGQVMDPMVKLKILLFPNTSNKRLVKKVYSHLIPTKNIISGIVPFSPKGVNLHINYSTREKPTLKEGLLEMIVEYCEVIPDGVVVFVATYDYLQNLRESWESSSLYTTLESKKDIVFEPNNIANAGQELQKYKDAIYSTLHNNHSSKTGAILFTAVNSEFSEMIDFKDRLARAVIMIGMPFTFQESPIWKEFKRHFCLAWDPTEIIPFLTEEQEAQERGGKLRPGKEIYVDQCFSSVNRSIGKVISHKNDFAAIILLDSRYSEYRNESRSSEWIRIKGGNNFWEPFERSLTHLSSFFEGR